MGTLASRMKKAMEASGMKAVDLHEKTGISKPSISEYLAGNYEPKQRNLFLIARALGVTPSYLMGVGDINNGLIREEMAVDMVRTTSNKAIPVIGAIACGSPISAQTDIRGAVVPDGRIKATYALIARGDSMINVGICDGDIVFVREQPEVEEGEIAVVFVDGEATLKKFYRHGNAVELRPANDDMKSMFFTSANCTEFRILGKCVGYMHGFE